VILTQFLCQIPDCTCFNQFEINFLELSLGSVNRTLLSQDVVSGVNLEGTARTYQQLPYTLCISPIYTFYFIFYRIYFFQITMEIFIQLRGKIDNLAYHVIYQVSYD